MTLPRELRATNVPHFMAEGEGTYHSETELGRLYDLAKGAEQRLGGGGGGGGGGGDGGGDGGGMAAGRVYDGRLFVRGCAEYLPEAAGALAVYHADLAQVHLTA